MILRITIPTAALGAFILLSAVDRQSAAAELPGRTPLTASTPARFVLPTSRSLPPVTRSDSTPLYTEDQATAGAALFAKVCAECHEKKDIAGPDFRSKWNGRKLSELYELVRTTMPDSDPGKFSRDEYAGAMAYILKQNGLPSGDKAIMPDSAAMSAVQLSLPPLPPGQLR